VRPAGRRPAAAAGRPDGHDGLLVTGSRPLHAGSEGAAERENALEFLSPSSMISSLLFIVICVLLIQTILCLRGSLGSQAERVARKRCRPSIPDVGNTNVGMTYGVLVDTATGGVFFWLREEQG
jgi:hypothetical protein